MYSFDEFDITVPSGWVPVITVVSRYVELDTTQGVERILSLSNEDFATLSDYADSYSSLDAEECRAHPAAAVLESYGHSVDGTYSVDVYTKTAYFGYWSMSGYMDRSHDFGAYDSLDALKKRMAEYWEHDEDAEESQE